MTVTGSDVILLAHSTFGVFGTMSALWVFVETLNAREENSGRIRTAAVAVALCMIATWILGGYWYIHFYPFDKELILNGPWPFAHTLFMETKEHLVIILLLLTTYLPIAASNELVANKDARKLVLWTSGIIPLLGLLIEGHGAIIAMGVKVALLAKQI